MEDLEKFSIVSLASQTQPEICDSQLSAVMIRTLALIFLCATALLASALPVTVNNGKCSFGLSPLNFVYECCTDGALDISPDGTNCGLSIGARGEY